MSQNDLIKSVLDQAPIVLFMVDTEGKLTLLAGAGCERLYINKVDALNKPAIKVRNLPYKAQIFKKALAGENITAAFHVAGYSYETEFKQIKAPDGTVLGVMGLSLDVSSRIEAEQKLDDERAKVGALQRLNSLAEMANGIAHEINNPLAIMSGFSEQLSALVSREDLDRERIKYVTARLGANCTRIARIIENLRIFSRDAGDDPIKPASISSIIDNTTILVQGMTIASGIALKVQDIDPALSIDARAVQIEQALFNLIANSCDAIRNRPNPWIQIDVVDRGDSVIIRITDSGPGIPENIRNKIMQPFFSTKEVGKGTGLGLSTTMGLLEAHQGHLRLIEDNPNTCFEIYLPKNQMIDLTAAS